MLGSDIRNMGRVQTVKTSKSKGKISEKEKQKIEGWGGGGVTDSGKRCHRVKECV